MQPLSLTFAGSSHSPAVKGEDLLPGKTNYLAGTDPSKWKRGIPNFARIRARNAYPGIDIVYYGNGRQLEFDIVVAPGADPGKIQLGVTGAGKLSIDHNGDLLLPTSFGILRQHSPVIYQEHGGVRQQVPGSFLLLASDRFGFRLGSWDRSRRLVIDPVFIDGQRVCRTAGGDLEVGCKVT